MVDGAELAFDHCGALEVVAHGQLIGHAHAAMDLDRGLANELGRATDLDLGCRNGLGAVMCAFVQLQGGHIGHGQGLFDIDEHVDHAVLQNLESGDSRTELLALTGIFQGVLVHPAHGTDALGADGGDGFVDNLLDQRQACTLDADQGISRDRHVLEIDFRGALAVNRGIVAGHDASRGLIDQEHRHA